MGSIPKNRLFVQVTYKDLLVRLWPILLFRINCEVYVSPELIDGFNRTALNRISRRLEANKILRRVHAPVYHPRNDQGLIFKQSYSKTVLFCRALGADAMVMHVEYEGEGRLPIDEWFKGAIEEWKSIASLAEKDGMSVLLENHNETSAEPIVRILNAVSSSHLKACFDIGHFNAFGEKDIVSCLDDYPQGAIKEVHLSDNLGDGDTHLALGKGNIDFMKFFNAIDIRRIDPVYTIEARNARGVVEGFNCLRRMGRL